MRIDQQSQEWSGNVINWLIFFIKFDQFLIEWEQKVDSFVSFDVLQVSGFEELLLFLPGIFSVDVCFDNNCILITEGCWICFVLDGKAC